VSIEIANAGNGANYYADNLFPDFLRGLLEGGASVTVVDSVFASGIQLPNRTWEQAIAESRNLTTQVFPGAHASIMVWPDNDESHGPFSPEQMQVALEAATRLSTGPVVVYEHHLIDGTFNWQPMLAAIKAAVGA